MKIKRPEIEIVDKEPFAEDKLERFNSAKILTTLVTSIDEPFVLALEGGWGHGKTTFIKMWSQHLVNEGYMCLSFNAWESDFSEDPLIPFVSEIRRGILQLSAKSGLTGEVEALVDKLKTLTIEVAKRSLPIAAKLATFGVLDEKAIASIAGDAIKSAVEEKFEEYEQSKDTLRAFQSTLEALVHEVKGAEKKTPLIFFIDELDRCRPTYALALLERIKHIFNITGIVFVLAIDRHQLMESVRSVYGQNADASRYLRRFINLEYSLPEPDPEHYPSFLIDLYQGDKNLINVTGNPHARDQFLSTFCTSSACCGMRLRDQEEAFSLLSLLFRMHRGQSQIDPLVLGLLMVLKVVRKDIYKSILSGSTAVLKEIMTLFLQHEKGTEFLSSNYGQVFEALLFVHINARNNVNAKLKQAQDIVQSPTSSPAESQRAQMQIPIYMDGSRNRDLRFLIQRLEISEQFSVS